MAERPAPTVLVIEDDALSLKMFRVLIEARGCRVLEAVEGFAGLALAHQHQPDLILMDWRLPGICGLPLVQALRDDKRTRTIPIVITTAYTSSADDPLVRAAACDGFVAKPIIVSKFLKTIALFVAGRRDARGPG
jgi:two-component system cell cycle response regulator DivK